MIDAALNKIEGTEKNITGVFTLAQFKKAGVSPTSVQRAVQLGELERVARGVYQLPKHNRICITLFCYRSYHFRKRLWKKKHFTAF